MHSPPISVCLTLGFASAYWHIRLRSASVSVFRGVDEVRPVTAGAEIGVCNGADGIGEAWKIGVLYEDWLVNMLGHCAVMSGCNDWYVDLGGGILDGYICCSIAIGLNANPSCSWMGDWCCEL